MSRAGLVGTLALASAVSVFLIDPAAAIAQRYLDGYEGPYRGRVVDAETKEPLAGAVVVAVWSRVRILPLHSSTVFYAARETLTQADGTFVLEAKELEENAPQRTLPPYFEIFFSGYGSLRSRPFLSRGFQQGSYVGTGMTVGLPRLRTREERREFLPSPFNLGVVAADDSNRPVWLQPRQELQHFLSLINVERAALGLAPLQY